MEFVLANICSFLEQVALEEGMKFEYDFCLPQSISFFVFSKHILLDSKMQAICASRWLLT